MVTYDMMDMYKHHFLILSSDDLDCLDIIAHHDLKILEKGEIEAREYNLTVFKDGCTQTQIFTQIYEERSNDYCFYLYDFGWASLDDHAGQVKCSATDPLIKRDEAEKQAQEKMRKARTAHDDLRQSVAMYDL